MNKNIKLDKWKIIVKILELIKQIKIHKNKFILNITKI